MVAGMSPAESPSRLKQSDLRRRMGDSKDARAVQTRARLVAAYRELLDEGAVASVTKVVQRAGVTRSSFYAHFADTSDLAATALTEFSEAIVQTARATVIAGDSTRQTNERVLVELVRFIFERQGTYLNLLEPEEGFRGALQRAFADQSLETLRTRTTLRADAEVTAQYVASGLLGVVTWWLDTNTELTPEELAAALIAIAPADFADGTSPLPADSAPDQPTQ